MIAESRRTLCLILAASLAWLGGPEQALAGVAAIVSQPGANVLPVGPAAIGTEPALDVGALDSPSGLTSTLAPATGLDPLPLRHDATLSVSVLNAPAAPALDAARTELPIGPALPNTALGQRVALTEIIPERTPALHGADSRSLAADLRNRPDASDPAPKAWTSLQAVEGQPQAAVYGATRRMMEGAAARRAGDDDAAPPAETGSADPRHSDLMPAQSPARKTEATAPEPSKPAYQAQSPTIEGRLRFWRAILLPIIRLLYRVRVHDVGNLPKGGALLIANHVSYVDIFLLTLAAGRPIRFLMYEDYYRSRWFHWFVKGFKPIPVRSALEVLQEWIEKARVVARHYSGHAAALEALDRAWAAAGKKGKKTKEEFRQDLLGAIAQAKAAVPPGDAGKALIEAIELATLAVEEDWGSREVDKAIEEARAAAEAGDLVLVFPEGHLTPWGGLTEFKDGFVRIARGLKVPVIPIFIDGLWGSFFSRKPFHFGWKVLNWIPLLTKYLRGMPRRISVRFGKPLKPLAQEEGTRAESDTSKKRYIQEAYTELSVLGVEGMTERIRWIKKPLPRAFLTAAKRYWWRKAVADSTGVVLRYGKLLTAALLMAWALKPLLPPGRDVGVFLPPTAGGVIANITPGILGKVPVNLNYTQSAAAADSVIRQVELDNVLVSVRKAREAASRRADRPAQDLLARLEAQVEAKIALLLEGKLDPDQQAAWEKEARALALLAGAQEVVKTFERKLAILTSRKFLPQLEIKELEKSLKRHLVLRYEETKALGAEAEFERVRKEIEAAAKNSEGRIALLGAKLRELGVENPEEIFFWKNYADRFVYLEDIKASIPKWKSLLTFLALYLLPRRLVETLFFRGAARSLDEIAAIIFTSGSSGTPKGAVHSHLALQSQIEALSDIYPTGPGDALLGVLPFFHVFGFTVTLWEPLLTGILGVYHSNPRDIQGIVKLAKKFRITHLFATPSFLNEYTDGVPADVFSWLKLVISGAEALRPEVAAAFKEKYGVDIRPGYGTTELAPVANVNPPDAPNFTGNRQETVGPPIPGDAELVVDPDTFLPVLPGQPGMLLVYGPNVMRGYLNDSSRTSKVMRGQWYITGDMAKMDETGYVTIVGRLSDFTKIDGEMVPNGEVSERLHKAAGLSEQTFAVAGVPDPKHGERLVVLYRKGYQGDLGAVVNRAYAQGMPAFWRVRPESFLAVDEIPVLGTGKLDLKRVKELALELAGKPREGPAVAAKHFPGILPLLRRLLPSRKGEEEALFGQAKGILRGLLSSDMDARRKIGILFRKRVAGFESLDGERIMALVLGKLEETEFRWAEAGEIAAPEDLAYFRTSPSGKPSLIVNRRLILERGYSAQDLAALWMHEATHSLNPASIPGEVTAYNAQHIVAKALKADSQNFSLLFRAGAMMNHLRLYEQSGNYLDDKDRLFLMRMKLADLARFNELLDKIAEEMRQGTWNALDEEAKLLWMKGRSRLFSRDPQTMSDQVNLVLYATDAASLEQVRAYTGDIIRRQREQAEILAR